MTTPERDRPFYARLGLKVDDRVLIGAVSKDFELTEAVMAPELGEGAVVALYHEASIGRHPVHERMLVFDAAQIDSPVRWWKVVAWCRQEGRDHIHTHYDGPADALPMNKLFELAAWTERRVMYRLAIRGPWLDCTEKIREEMRRRVAANGGGQIV